MANLVKIIVLNCLFFTPSQSQLLINVKNQGGDVMQENITANVSEDTVTLEFLRLDGVFVSQLVDFANEVEALRLIVPPEEELGTRPPQQLCFLSHAGTADFIAPDAMVKLRQKNPGTIRVAEEERGWRQLTTTAWGTRVTRVLSAPAARLCGAAAAHGNVFLRHADLARWPPRPGLEPGSEAVTPFPSEAGDGADAAAAPACVSARGREGCLCDAEVCVNWYPCGLKYCKGKPAGGLSYRCGIKTCRRCYRYRYYARRRDHCIT